MAKITLTIECDNYQTEQVLPFLVRLLDADSNDIDLSNELAAASLLQLIRQLRFQFVHPSRANGMTVVHKDKDKRQLWQTLFEHMQFAQSDFNLAMLKLTQAQEQKHES